MFQESEIIPYEDIVRSIAGRRIQKGMNYKVKDKYNIFLMNTSETALYSDQIEESGTIIYEGHNVPKSKNCTYPNRVDQQERNKDGTLTENGKFFDVAMKYRNHITDNAEYTFIKRLKRILGSLKEFTD